MTLHYPENDALLLFELLLFESTQKKLFFLHREEKLNSMLESKSNWDNRAS